MPGVRLQVELANQAQAVFYSAKSREPGEGIQVRHLALRPGETSYYVVIRSTWIGPAKEGKRGFNATQPYTLTMSLEPASGHAELEPNDEPAKATVLTAPGEKIGFFAPKGDVDFFSVRVDRTSLLRVELTGVDRVDSMLSLVEAPLEGEPADKEKSVLRANDGAIREGEILVNVAATPEREVLLRAEAAARQVDGKWVRDQENSEIPYRLIVTAKPDDGLDEREPNNGPETATPIALGGAIRGLVHPKKDVDYYRLDLTSSPVKVPLRATLTGILKVDVSLSLFRLAEDGKLALVQKSEKAKGEQPESIRYTVEPGVYFLEVRDTRNFQSNFVDAYQLRLEAE